jgi:hypothetical protein
MQAIFGNKQQQPAAPVNPTNNPALNAPIKGGEGSAGTAPNSVIPAGGRDAPLAAHKDLWAPIPEDPNAPKPVTMPSAQEIMNATSKVDFKQVLDPKLMEAVRAGGEGSEQALAQLINQAAQAGYGQSVIAAQKLVDNAVAQKTEEFNASIPALLRKQMTNEQLLKTNPGFSNPVVAPVVEIFANQLQAKYPKATSEELVAMAKEVLIGTAQILNPPPVQKPSKDKQEDWSAYFSGGNPNSLSI